MTTHAPSWAPCQHADEPGAPTWAATLGCLDCLATTYDLDEAAAAQVARLLTQGWSWWPHRPQVQADPPAALDRLVRWARLMAS